MGKAGPPAYFLKTITMNKKQQRINQEDRDADIHSGHPQNQIVTMRNFRGSPKFENLTDMQFEAFMDWFYFQQEKRTIIRYRKNEWFLYGGWGKPSIPNKLTIHQVLEYWYYEILKP